MPLQIDSVMSISEINELLVKPITQRLDNIAEKIEVTQKQGYDNHARLIKIETQMKSEIIDHDDFAEKMSKMEARIESINEFVVQRKEREKFLTLVAGVFGAVLTWAANHISLLFAK